MYCAMHVSLLLAVLAVLHLVIGVPRTIEPIQAVASAKLLVESLVPGSSLWLSSLLQSFHYAQLHSRSGSRYGSHALTEYR